MHSKSTKQEQQQSKKLPSIGDKIEVFLYFDLDRDKPRKLTRNSRCDYEPAPLPCPSGVVKPEFLALKDDMSGKTYLVKYRSKIGFEYFAEGHFSSHEHGSASANSGLPKFTLTRRMSCNQDKNEAFARLEYGYPAA